jgi:hypothetical protein
MEDVSPNDSYFPWRGKKPLAASGLSESDSQVSKSDGMRRPVSDGMLYAPKYPRARGTEKKETGNEKG